VNADGSGAIFGDLSFYVFSSIRPFLILKFRCMPRFHPSAGIAEAPETLKQPLSVPFGCLLLSIVFLQCF